MQQWLTDKGPMALGLLWYLHAILLLRMTVATRAPTYRLLTDAESRAADAHHARLGYAVFLYSLMLYTMTYLVLWYLPS